jgi:ribosomal protein S18 acetylase RimI-like enzyme
MAVGGLTLVVIIAALLFSRGGNQQLTPSNSIVIGLVDECDRLIGFIRVLTDFIYRAFIFDVIVKPTHRNQGLGKQLLDSVVHHPQLQSVEYFGLYCLPEMVPFYEPHMVGAQGLAPLQMAVQM